jgi:hypothetical protein
MLPDRGDRRDVGNLQQRKVVLQPVVGGKSSFDLSGQPEHVLP